MFVLSSVWQRPAFFALRLTLATCSAASEAIFYRAIVRYINAHIGKYVFVSMVTSAAFYSAATAFLPSTFALYAALLGGAAFLAPVDSDAKRITRGVTAFAAGAVVGWPFSVVLGVPLVLEQLFLRGTEKVAKGTEAAHAAKRARNLLIALTAGASILIPVIAIDTQAYQKLTIVPLNILRYNLLGDATHGPELYGTEPASFYLLNGLVNFNVLFPLALLSLPALWITSVVDPKRFGDRRDLVANQTAPAAILASKLSPMYLWLAVLSTQAHKEERFLFPAYGFILFNAATTLFLARSWAEVAFVKITKSPYRVTRSPIFSYFTRAVLGVSVFLSLGRIIAVHSYYHAPLTVYHHLQSYELPRLAVSLHPELYPNTLDAKAPFANFTEALGKLEYRFDLSPLGEEGLRLCLGKEWHRFPSHWLVPEEVEVRFIKSEFDGILPKVWEQGKPGQGLWDRATGVVPKGMNDRNAEEVDRYVDVETCHYLVDLDFPLRAVPAESKLEPRFAVQADKWDRVRCQDFLDAQESNQLTRAIKLPVPGWQKGNSYGDYCLLRNKNLLA